MNDQEAFLRQKAQQCRDMARYHTGDAAAALQQMADELEAKADELAQAGGRVGPMPTQRAQLWR